MLTQQNKHHYAACMQFADSVALMARKRFREARLYSDSAYKGIIELFGANHADAQHVRFYGLVLGLVSGDNIGTGSATEWKAAQGILQAWEGCKNSLQGANLWNTHGPNQQSIAYFNQAGAHFVQAISLIETNLGKMHPELFGPLAD